MRRDEQLNPGSRLGQYTIGEALGEGGHATVYLAQDAARRTVALKVMRADGTRGTRRFLREFESLRLLRVPGVVRVHEAAVEGELLWFSMDRVFGRPYNEALHDEGYMPDRVERAVALALALLRTLASLHASGFAHRDIKPSNVLVDAGGTPHVLDFGVAQWFATEGPSTDIVLGTVPYMAPEHVASLPIGLEADVYAAGLLIHESIAGLPDKPANPLGWVSRTCLERRPPLATRFREVPLSLSKLVERMTAIDPTDRPTAAQAADTLQAIHAGDRGNEWPEPAFVDPGSWWGPCEGVLGLDPRVCVIEGVRGSGRTRVAEQVQRIGLLEGRWTLKLSCCAHRVGAPFRQLLERLCDTLRDDALARIVGDDFDAIGPLWPHLPLPRNESEQSVHDSPQLTAALANIIRRLSEQRHVLLVIANLEQIDGLSSKVLQALTRRGPPLLMIHEVRWSTPASRRLVQQLVEAGAVSVRSGPHADLPAIAATLSPDLVLVKEASTPLDAVHLGHTGLARWRAEQIEPFDSRLEQLGAFEEPVPVPVSRTIGGPTADTLPWTTRVRGAVALDGQTARDLAEARCADRSGSCRDVAVAWERALGQRADPAALARLWMLAEEPRVAWPYAARAAIDADRRGRYGEAREWILLTESMRAPRASERDFELALVKAHVALRTDALTSRRVLLEAADDLATSQDDLLRVRALESEYALREGSVRTALASALHVGSNRDVGPLVSSEALLLAVRARLALGDTLAARRELDRATERLAGLEGSESLALRASGLDAELAWRARDLTRCDKLCDANIARAKDQGDIRSEGAALARKAAVLRLLGRRSEAESLARQASVALAVTRDVFLDTDARLAQATLESERGELIEARARLDRALRQIRGLHLDHLVARAMRIALRIAAARADVNDATVPLALLQERPNDDDEAPAALVRWWRSRGDHDNALAVPRPIDPGFGRGLWHVERARVRLAARSEGEARDEAAMALVIAGMGGFSDLLLYARLMVDGLGNVQEETWTNLKRRAAASPWVNLSLAALDLDARRRGSRGEDAARSWRTLAARAAELGYQSDADDANGWLKGMQ